ncbi:hypothetical protein BDP27DRAFT_1369794 [Rhodocollybia butyracea]|uniref:Uncharacterized protein n=1 Tax=Rhodocollybia butyracea TaxID=206335 RepID=A0A9P5PDF9_9AGAR|nr:hypothetical protein BDP27DRAFT_1369794 [Rhodocollybia butyracea]
MSQIAVYKFQTKGSKLWVEVVISQFRHGAFIDRLVTILRTSPPILFLFSQKVDERIPFQTYLLPSFVFPSGKKYIGSQFRYSTPYLIIAGIGRGSGQIPFIAVQVAITPEEHPIGFSQVRKFAPSIDPSVVVNSGATEFRHIVPAEALGVVLQTYSKAIDTVLIPTITRTGIYSKADSASSVVA